MSQLPPTQSNISLKTKILTLLIWAFFFNSCSEYSSELCSTEYSIEEKQAETKIEAVNVVVPNELRSEYYLYDILEEENSFTYAGWDDKNSRLNLYNSDQNYWREVDIDNKYLNGSLASIVLASNDSIFLLRQENPLLYLFDS